MRPISLGQKWPSGRWGVPFQSGAIQLTTNNGTWDRLRATPFRTQAGGIITGLGVNITAAGAGTRKTWMGVYLDNGTGYPGAFVGFTGEIDYSAGAGIYSATGLYLPVPPNTVAWLAHHHTATSAPTLMAVPVAQIDPVIGNGATIDSTVEIGVYAVAVYSATPPAVFPGGASYYDPTSVSLQAIFAMWA